MTVRRYDGGLDTASNWVEVLLLPMPDTAAVPRLAGAQPPGEGSLSLGPPLAMLEYPPWLSTISVWARESAREQSVTTSNRYGYLRTRAARNAT